MKTLLGFRLSDDFTRIEPFGPTGYCYRHVSGLFVIETTAPQSDNCEWLHVSMSFPDRLPSYEDMKLVKAQFVGPKNEALQVFPPESKHINIHEYCLHLWHCIDCPVMPDSVGSEGTI